MKAHLQERASQSALYLFIACSRSTSDATDVVSVFAHRGKCIGKLFLFISGLAGGQILQRFLSESEFFLGFHLLPPERVGGSVLVGQKPDDNKPIL